MEPYRDSGRLHTVQNQAYTGGAAWEWENLHFDPKTFVLALLNITTVCKC